MNIKSILKIVLSLFRTVNVTKVNVTPVLTQELLKNRCAIVTGGTSGIGFAIAKAFLQSGAYVIITGRSQFRIDEAIKELNSENVIGVELDNRKVDSFQQVFGHILHQIECWGKQVKVDILVNNAGVNGKSMPNAKEDEYDAVVETNLKGVFFLSQMFGKYMVKEGIKGNILNIASASCLRPVDSAYSVSKWGIRGLTLGLAKSLAKNGITVNGIAPGPTATPMMNVSIDSNMRLERLPLGRYITAEEIANMATILVSDMSRSVMGDIIFMTGGAGLLTYDDVEYSF